MATISGTPDLSGNLHAGPIPGSPPGTLQGIGAGPPAQPMAQQDPGHHGQPNGHNGVSLHPAPNRGTRASPSAAGQQARRLIAAANELLALAAELEEEATRGHLAAAPRVEEAPSPLDDDARWLRHARRLYRHRRSRGHVFGDENLFGEPGWDILIDLFIAAKERKRVPVTSACIGAAVPTTTALRWLAVLEERGLILREADQSDARRIFVRLSTEAYARMVSYFARAATAEADDTIEAVRAVGKALEQMRS